ncbi:hypothetical protein SKAU_G00171050 [Synaphobranchus kaupii]|uniref:Uncharacterized protein n=1 Tax=Synaphobranchus kaupii TaxID=118154 RepID=A0A9Q1FKE0_SYNKA|nr:hypothetical protein SKAU_G00171050 [Synaphobranchus kaupii]
MTCQCLWRPTYKSQCTGHALTTPGRLLAACASRLGLPAGPASLLERNSEEPTREMGPRVPEPGSPAPAQPSDQR